MEITCCSKIYKQQRNPKACQQIDSEQLSIIDFSSKSIAYFFPVFVFQKSLKTEIIFDFLQ